MAEGQKPAVTEAAFHLARNNGEKMEVALQWTEATDETIRSYVNGIRTSAGGARDFVHLSGESRPPITLCGRDSVQIHERSRPVDFAVMKTRLAPHGEVRHNDFVLKFWKEPYEMTLFPDGRAVIKGTTDMSVARSLYARYIGS